MRRILHNGKVITPRQVFSGGVVMADGIITKVFRGSAPAIDGDRVDCCGQYISPGFVDIHIHAVLGGNTMDGTPESLAKVTELHGRHGTTSMLPTTCSAPRADILKALWNIKAQMALPPRGAHILGAHMEGTYFSPVMAGAQDPRFLYPPRPEEYMELIDTGCVKRVSAAPEIDGSLDMARRLVPRGIQMSIGHSNGKYQDAINAAQAGYTSLTHIYNAESTLNSIYFYPDVGMSEACLMNDDIRIECIADGCHLSENLLKYIYKIKGADGMFAVTDAAFSGAPDGKYRFMDTDVEVLDGVCMMADHHAFAGSIATMDRCLRTLYKGAGISLLDSVAICTSTPAKVIGMQNRIGTLAEGFDADVVVFDDDIRLSHVYVLGEPVL